MMRRSAFLQHKEPTMRDLAIAGEVTEKHIPGHSALNGAVAVPILTIL
ncbi:MAG: hypothetical protein ACI9GW_002574, partial [Halieaceae bacterium]